MAESALLYGAIDRIADDTNAALAQYGMHLCWGTGKCGQVFSDTDLQMNASLMIPDDHVVVVMSKYGLKERWQSVLEHFQKRHVPVLLIAGGRKPEAWPADFVICTLFCQRHDLADEMDYYVAAKYVIDLLFWSLFEDHKEEARFTQSLREAIFFRHRVPKRDSKSYKFRYSVPQSRRSLSLFLSF